MSIQERAIKYISNAAEDLNKIQKQLSEHQKNNPTTDIAAKIIGTIATGFKQTPSSKLFDPTNLDQFG